MDPTQNQYPIDYLNQIAPAPQKSGPSPKLFMILVGLGVFAFIIISLVVFSNLSAGPTNDAQRLAARLATLKTVAVKAQPIIKSSQLRSTNSSLTISLSNASRDLSEPLTAIGIDPKKIDKEVTASEANQTLVDRLDDARLNAIYDDTYAREMSYQLATTLSLMNKIYNGSSSKQMKDYLIATDKNFEPIKKQFDEFNPTDS